MKPPRKYILQDFQTPRLANNAQYKDHRGSYDLDRGLVSYSMLEFYNTFKLHPRPCLTARPLYCLDARPPAGVNSQVPFSKWYLRPFGFK